MQSPAPRDTRCRTAKASLDIACQGPAVLSADEGARPARAPGSKDVRPLETMFMSPPLRKLIMHNAGATEIAKLAVAEGMLTLRMDGWLKVTKGITTRPRRPGDQRLMSNHSPALPNAVERRPQQGPFKQQGA